MSITNRSQMELLVRILHHLTAHFKEHAILKGGIELALFSSSRATNDLDFVFVPFSSKKDIAKEIETCLKSLEPNVQVTHSLSSKNAKYYVQLNGMTVEVEASVDEAMESIVMNTAVLARPLNLPTHIVRVMKPEIALAHKIAAWNERRLLRDLYDMYFWFSVQQIHPDRGTLERRLKKVESRQPALKGKTTITVDQLCKELKTAIDGLSQKEIDMNLVGLPNDERMHLDVNMRSQIMRLIHFMQSHFR